MSSIYMPPVKKILTVPEMLAQVDYRRLADPAQYTPTFFAWQFVNFIKKVNGEEGEENSTPLFHYAVLDSIGRREPRIANLIFRGSGKTTVIGEYSPFFIAIHGGYHANHPLFFGLYVTDSIDNGVKSMRNNLEARYDKSPYLQKVLDIDLTLQRWVFINKLTRQKFIMKGYGVLTGVRGTKEQNKRPDFAIFDDVMKDTDALSDANMTKIEDTLFKAVPYALRPNKNFIIWNGTPFNQNDPLYRAVESGAWSANVYPIANEFPCKKEDFVGAWEDRFSYEAINREYQHALEQGKASDFMQELMLTIGNPENRLISNNEIMWYNSSKLDLRACNIYITTDFATSAKESADYNVIAVWAVDKDGKIYLVDGIRKKQKVKESIAQVFAYAEMYEPISVGIEISGQQQGFLDWILDEMDRRNVYMPLASNKRSSNTVDLGIRPTANKFNRFMSIVPWFQTRRFHFPEDKKTSDIMVGIMSEIELAANNGFKSKNDDCLDVISQLNEMELIRPSGEVLTQHDDIMDKVGDNRLSPFGRFPMGVQTKASSNSGLNILLGET